MKVTVLYFYRIKIADAIGFEPMTNLDRVQSARSRIGQGVYALFARVPFQFPNISAFMITDQFCDLGLANSFFD